MWMLNSVQKKIDLELAIKTTEDKSNTKEISFIFNHYELIQWVPVIIKLHFRIDRALPSNLNLTSGTIAAVVVIQVVAAVVIIKGSFWCSEV